MTDRPAPQGPCHSRHSRRDVLRLAAGGGAAALFAACGLDGGDAPAEAGDAAEAVPAGLTTATPEARAAAAAPAAEAVAASRPVPAAGRERVALMPESQWETPLVATHSGRAGPALLVLGGVHGNEPGGWLAADAVAEWTPRRGSLLVVPRANVIAIGLLERTTEELGDLNRLYPGSFEEDPPMTRMAAHIVDIARRYHVDFVLDLHESWGFYTERGDNGGTAFLGQTITSGPGPERVPLARAIAGRVNAQIEVERDRLLARDWTQWPAPIAEGEPLAGSPQRLQWRPGRGGSSLSLGRFVPGVAPLLVEMAQQQQPVARRVELHQLVVRSTLDLLGMT